MGKLSLFLNGKKITDLIGAEIKISNMEICENCHIPMAEITAKDSKHYHFICSECGSETVVNKKGGFPGDLIDEMHSYT